MKTMHCGDRRLTLNRLVISRQFGWRTLALATLLALAGCATNPLHSSGQAEKLSDSSPKESLPRVLTDEGLKRLSERKYDDASRIFNAGLKFSPTNPKLHFLNALTYHLQYLDGNESVKDLAVIGYELALSEDPAFFAAALQLGRLQLHAKRYTEAVGAFERASAIQPKSPDANLGLAAAAYYSHDLTRAGVAAERAAALRSSDVEISRAVALIKAALGDSSGAKVALARHASLEKNLNIHKRLESRVADWRDWHEENLKAEDDLQLRGQVLAQAASQSVGVSAAGGSPQGTPLDDEKPWYACPDSVNLPAGSNSSTTDPPTLPRIPMPCKGSRHKMAILDVAIVRAEDNETTSFGTNLLDHLNFTFGVGKLVVNNVTTGGSPSESQTTQTSWARGIGVGGVSVGSLPSTSYSLNIANATGNRSEVLARPSLVALDGMPSTFFSGRNVTVGLAGTQNSSASFSDKPVGISMSVTPTFVDGDTLMLAVRAERAFIESVDLNVTFGQQLQTARNMVSANVSLKMGQTLILSGLAERQTSRTYNGVPVLKDIPLIRYLFNQKTTIDFRSSVLILVTPRPAAYDQDLMQRVGVKHIARNKDPRERELGVMIEKEMQDNPNSIPENMEWTYARTVGNRLYLQFRTGDLTIESWSEPSSWEAFLKGLRNAFYF